VADQLREAEFQVEDFKGSRRAQQEKDFFNRRSEAYWSLRQLLEAGEIELPPDEDLAAELCAIEYEFDGSGRVKLESKEGLSSRLGRSPDLADATVMAFFDGESRSTELFRFAV
jgi:hypothetical protein